MVFFVIGALVVLASGAYLYSKHKAAAVAPAVTANPAPPASGGTVAGGTVVAPAPAALPAGFASAPNANGDVQLVQVEADRAKYANDPDPAYRYWAKTMRHWLSFKPTLDAFNLTDAQRAKLNASLAGATELLSLQGAAGWDCSYFANIPDSAAFSTGVNFDNLADALAHQRAHVKAINPQGLDTTPPVAGPGNTGGGQFK